MDHFSASHREFMLEMGGNDQLEGNVFQFNTIFSKVGWKSMDMYLAEKMTIEQIADYFYYNYNSLSLSPEQYQIVSILPLTPFPISYPLAPFGHSSWRTSMLELSKLWEIRKMPRIPSLKRA
jgi:hypothetical protein